MAVIRLGLAGLNQTPLDWRGNIQRLKSAITEAHKLQIDVLAFPELCLTGYGCEDAFFSPHVAEYALAALPDLADHCNEMVVLVGLPFLFEGTLYNGMAVLAQRQVHAICLKTHLARTGIHYEPRWFTGWSLGQRAQCSLDGRDIPIGSLTMTTDLGFRFGVEICEDAWVSDDLRPCRNMQDPHFVFNCSASHFSMGKADVRENILRATTRTWPFGYGYTNLVGCESGRAIYDGEMLFALDGAIVNRSKRLYMQDWRILAYDLTYHPQQLIPDNAVVLPHPATRTRPPLSQSHGKRIFPSREEEFAQAASLALFDYMRKSRANGFTLSLSGGVDSSTVAVLVWVLAYRLVSDLDPVEVRQKLHHMDLPLEEGCRAVVARLLTCVYQATRNSGPVTRHAAQGLAQAIGARYLTFDIDDLVEGYKQMVGEAIQRDWSWEKDDLVLQNIQARVRSPGIWMIANHTRSLLLSTSNRSEVAVGYATMDGDTSGGLAPIAGVEKTFLRRFLRAMEQGLVTGFPALPELKAVNDQNPTAELRPPDQVQEDEKDLMPYPVLDALEAALMGDRLSPLNAWLNLQQRFSDYTAQQLYQWTHRFCRMFSISQWKRERYAPAFHLDDRNLDPKTWARFPILNAGFEGELQELEKRYQEQHGV